MGMAMSRINPHSAFNFFIEIEGLLLGSFAEVTGLSSTTEVEEYREGGVNGYVHKLPRQTTYAALTMRHGLTDGNILWNWYDDVTRGVVTRRNGSIMLLDRMRIPVMWWDFRNAFPVSWKGPELRANSDQVAFESLDLVHEGLSKPYLSQALSLAHLAVPR